MITVLLNQAEISLLHALPLAPAEVKRAINCALFMDDTYQCLLRYDDIKTLLNAIDSASDHQTYTRVDLFELRKKFQQALEKYMDETYDEE